MITKATDWGKLFKKENIQKEMIQILEKGNSQVESEGAVTELSRIKRMNRRQCGWLRLSNAEEKQIF